MNHARHMTKTIISHKVAVANKAVEAIKQTSGFNYTAGTAQDVICKKNLSVRFLYNV